MPAADDREEARREPDIKCRTYHDILAALEELAKTDPEEAEKRRELLEYEWESRR